MPLLLAAILVAALLAALVVPKMINPARPVRVPQLAGQPVEAARATARQTGLQVTTSAESSATVPNDTVIRQDPAANATTQSDQPVRLVVSSGLPPVRVPNLAGRRVTDAQTDLAALGLLLGHVAEKEVTTAPAGAIVEQATPAGNELARGAAVDVIVAVRPMVSVPRLADKSIGDAEAELEKDGLHLGQVHLEPSSGKMAGTVLSQDPASDVKLRNGDRVSVTIAVPPSS